MTAVAWWRLGWFGETELPERGFSRPVGASEGGGGL